MCGTAALVAGGWRVNRNQIRQLFEQFWGGRGTEALHRFAHALRRFLAQGYGSRRPMAGAVAQAEILEIRQVLSVVNPVTAPNGTISNTFESNADALQLNEETELSDSTSGDVLSLDADASTQSRAHELPHEHSSTISDWNPFSDSRFPATDTQDAGRTGTPFKSTSAVSVPEASLAISLNSASPLIGPFDSIVASSMRPAASPQASSVALAGIVDQNLIKGHLETASTTSTGFNLAISRRTPNAAPIPSSNCSWQSIAGTALTLQTQRGTLYAESEFIEEQNSAEGENSDSSQNSVLGEAGIEGALPGWRAAFTEIDGFFADIDLFTLISLTATDGTSQSTVSFVPGETLPVAVPMLASDGVRQSSFANMSGATQLQVKQLRDGHRLYFHPEVHSVDFVQFDMSPHFHADEDIPRALKHVALPRGPPHIPPETVLRIMDSDAAAHVLERLRYSIAPRGPSTVTAEMPSPEERSFSGPRVSTGETCHMRLAC